MTESAANAAMPHPGVKIPPPFVFAAAFLIGWLIETKVGPLPLINNPKTRNAVELLATIIAINGFALVAWGMLTFHRAKTGIIPIRPATQLVDTGPYRFSRNPMYSGFTMMYAGFAWMMNTGWPLLMLPLALFALHQLVIKREERYLLGKFGEQYEAYRRRVSRWF